MLTANSDLANKECRKLPRSRKRENERKRKKNNRENREEKNCTIKKKG